MEFKQIQELIKIINKSNISEISLEENDFKITIKQKDDQIAHLVSHSVPSQAYAVPIQNLPQAPSGSLQLSSPSAGTIDGSKEEANNYIEVKSPMIGTFYRKSGPDKPNFVEVGDEITEDKVLCIIEAMKLFNEIESEVKGKIVKILVEDASPVEYDQPLFLVDPS